MVQVQTQTIQEIQNQANTSVIGGVTIHWNVIMPIITIAIIGGIIIAIVMFIISKIVKRIKLNNRIKDDLEFRKYYLDKKNCEMNKKIKYKYKNPLTIWLLYKKAKIYLNTSEGKKFCGYYEGELVKKEGYFILAIELRQSFFKREVDLVIFPYKLKKYMIRYNDDFTIDLFCEGIDEVISSEYFSMPVFNNKSNKDKKQIFLDFSDEIIKNYYEKYGYREILKENINQFSENIKKATEMNSQITINRKTRDD